MRSGHSLAFQYFEEVLSKSKFNALIKTMKAVSKLAIKSRDLREN